MMNDTCGIEVPRQGTGRGWWRNQGGAALAPAYGEFALSGRKAPDHAPTGRTIPHAPAGHFTVVQGKRSAALGHGNAVGMSSPVPHAPKGHFTVARGNAVGMTSPVPHAPSGHITVAQGNALGTQTEREYALKGHFNMDFEVPRQGTGRGWLRNQGGAALAPAYGEFALSGRSISHAPMGRNIPDHAPTGHFTVDQGKQSAALGQGNALGTQPNQTCALKGHFNNVAWTFGPWPLSPIGAVQQKNSRKNS